MTRVSPSRTSTSAPRDSHSDDFPDPKLFSSRFAHTLNQSLLSHRSPMFQGVWLKRLRAGMRQLQSTRVNITGRIFSCRICTTRMSCRRNREFWKRSRREASPTRQNRQKHKCSEYLLFLTSSWPMMIHGLTLFPKTMSACLRCHLRR